MKTGRIGDDSADYQRTAGTHTTLDVPLLACTRNEDAESELVVNVASEPSTSLVAVVVPAPVAMYTSPPTVLPVPAVTPTCKLMHTKSTMTCSNRRE